jgi:TonB family protein
MPPDLKATCRGKGTIGIQMVVGEDGSLVSTRLVSSSGVAACDDFFLNVVRSARFKPAIATDGRPIEWQFGISASIPP